MLSLVREVGGATVAAVAGRPRERERESVKERRKLNLSQSSLGVVENEGSCRRATISSPPSRRLAYSRAVLPSLSTIFLSAPALSNTCRQTAENNNHTHTFIKHTQNNIYTHTLSHNTHTHTHTHTHIAHLSISELVSCS